MTNVQCLQAVLRVHSEHPSYLTRVRDSPCTYLYPPGRLFWRAIVNGFFADQTHFCIERSAAPRSLLSVPDPWIFRRREFRYDANDGDYHERWKKREWSMVLW